MTKHHKKRKHLAERRHTIHPIVAPSVARANSSWYYLHMQHPFLGVAVLTWIVTLLAVSCDDKPVSKPTPTIAPEATTPADTWITLPPLPPAGGAALMSVSTVVVAINAQLLYRSGRNRAVTSKERTE